MSQTFHRCLITLLALIVCVKGIRRWYEMFSVKIALSTCEKRSNEWKTFVREQIDRASQQNFQWLMNKSSICIILLIGDRKDFVMLENRSIWITAYRLPKCFQQGKRKSIAKISGRPESAHYCIYRFCPLWSLFFGASNVLSSTPANVTGHAYQSIASLDPFTKSTSAEVFSDWRVTENFEDAFA